jgi:hypothetical protein
MKRGYTKSYRKELDSDIWIMPPLYHRVWFYLRSKAKWEQQLFPTKKKFGIWVNPGQLITSIDLIAYGVQWTEWGKEKKPNKKTIKSILNWLEGNGMILVESNATGTFINIVNWGTYNDNNQENVTESNQQAVTENKHLLDTIKELQKKLKNKDKKNTPFRAIDYLVEKGIEKETANEWLKVRKGKRLTPTETAFKAVLKQIEKTGRSNQEIIKICVERSWGGFNASWDLGDGAGKPTGDKICDSGCASFQSCKGINKLKLGENCGAYCIPDDARR